MFKFDEYALSGFIGVTYAACAKSVDGLAAKPYSAAFRCLRSTLGDDTVELRDAFNVKATLDEFQRILHT